MVELQGYQRYIYRCTPAKVNPLIAHTTTIMKLRHIFRFPGMLAISALIAGMATGVTSCKETTSPYQANHISISRGLKTVWYHGRQRTRQDKWAFAGRPLCSTVKQLPVEDIIPIDGGCPTGKVYRRMRYIRRTPGG